MEPPVSICNEQKSEGFGCGMVHHEGPCKYDDTPSSGNDEKNRASLEPFPYRGSNSASFVDKTDGEASQ